MKEIGADFYVSNCHKWMYSGKGSAFLYINDKFLNKIHPISISNFYNKGTSVEFMWSGTNDFSARLSILSSLEFVKKLGSSKIIEYNHKNALIASSRLVELWDTELSISRKDNPNYENFIGNLVAIKLPIPKFETSSQAFGHAEWLHNKLWSQYNIEVPITVLDFSLYVRISVQIYNTLEEYEQLGKAISEIYNLNTRKKD